MRCEPPEELAFLMSSSIKSQTEYKVRGKSTRSVLREAADTQLRFKFTIMRRPRRPFFSFQTTSEMAGPSPK